jgi:hypothetical protein
MKWTAHPAPRIVISTGPRGFTTVDVLRREELDAWIDAKAVPSVTTPRTAA